MELGTMLANKEKQLIEENKSRTESEKNLENEIKLRKESETARDLLEADIQEKQDTIITLRGQLDEVKGINIQLFKKMQEKDCEIKDKNAIISDYEMKFSQLKKEIKHWEKKFEMQKEDRTDSDLLDNYQKLVDEQQHQIKQLQNEIDDFQMQRSLNLHLKEAYNLLKKKYDENELSLEEIGKQLQE